MKLDDNVMCKQESLLFIFILISIFGCGPKESPQKKMTSINGEVIYIFNKDGSIKALFKEEFNNYNFAILPSRDTIVLGDDFISSIYVTNPLHMVEITSPASQIILSDSTKENDFKTYRFNPHKEGVYDFTGLIKYDTFAMPFRYKFIVIKKD